VTGAVVIRLASTGPSRPWLRYPSVRAVGRALLESSLQPAEWWPRRSALGLRARQDQRSGAAVMDLSGRLSRASVPLARAALLACFGLCPTAVVVRVHEMRASRPAVLSVFPATQRRAAHDPYVPLLLCGPQHASPHPALGPHVPVYPDVDEALALIGTGVPGRGFSQLRLPAQPDAAARARGFVASTCRDWGVEHVADAAKLIITELVGNAVLHAGTAVDVTLTRRPRGLHLAVRDGAPDLPHIPDIDHARAEGGRGLRLVGAYAARWGTLTAPASKIVWADLPLGATG
jgi:anti-sigma regulatory factor (Ser/Thr protein kinase)